MPHPDWRALPACLVLACISEAPPPPPSPTPDEAPSPTQPAEAPQGPVVLGSAAVADEGQAVGTTLLLSTVGNEMKYDQSALTAAPGLVRLTFTNKATYAAMQHNVVIVVEGAADAVGPAGIGAGPQRHYVPDDPQVLAATPLLGPGQTGTLVADLKPGTYTFVCTFPGHYLVMRGTLKVG